jgi:three-Cys-motif partner protein
MPDDDETGWLFPLPKEQPPEKPLLYSIKRPLWTANKAKLIQRYLRTFVFITHHGTYIDLFTGPQEPKQLDTWAAKLVVEIEPKWLRHFYLFEKHAKRIQQIEQLKLENSDRHIEPFPGDCNVRIHELLDRKSIREKEATFCLLDQRTFQCHWTTVTALATYKTEGNKIELFYFFPKAWYERAIAGIRNTDILKRWWGRDDWKRVLAWRAMKCVNEMEQRFRTELGYKSARAFPIYKDPQGRSIMYWMIHATDHPEAPTEMLRAYNAVGLGLPAETKEQLMFRYNNIDVDEPPMD